MWQHFNVCCRQMYTGTDQNLTELLLVTLIVTFRCIDCDFI